MIRRALLVNIVQVCYVRPVFPKDRPVQIIVKLKGNPIAVVYGL